MFNHQCSICIPGWYKRWKVILNLYVSIFSKRMLFGQFLFFAIFLANCSGMYLIKIIQNGKPRSVTRYSLFNEVSNTLHNAHRDWTPEFNYWRISLHCIAQRFYKIVNIWFIFICILYVTFCIILYRINRVTSTTWMDETTNSERFLYLQCFGFKTFRDREVLLCWFSGGKDAMSL